MYEINTLVIYKQMPALIKDIKSDKLVIELINGKIKKIREKDVLYLLKNVKSLKNIELEQNIYENIDFDEILELLSEEDYLSLEEITELLYEEINAQSIYNSYRILQDGIYFKGNIDKIKANSKEFINNTIRKREEKEKEKIAYEEFLTRLKNKKIIQDDLKRIQELEKIALGLESSNKLIKNLHLEANPLKIHQYLLDLGLWNDSINPYPIRKGCFFDNLEDYPFEILSSEIERKDLTHLNSYAIDSKETHDPDDAISIDGKYLWIHIADLASIIKPNSEIDKEAKERGSSLYLPNAVINMIPRNIIQHLGLGLNDKSFALSFKIEIKASGEPICHEISPSIIKVKRITYDELDKIIDQEPFSSIMKYIDYFINKRDKVKLGDVYMPEVDIKVYDFPIVKKKSYLELESDKKMPDLKFSLKNIKNSSSQKLVSNAMILTGEAVANWLYERKIPSPYITQEAPDEIRTSENLPKKLSEKLAYIKTFKKSKFSLKPEPHASLGIDKYVHVTSPLRRYVDLLTHQQIYLFLENKELMSESEIEEKMARAEYCASMVNMASRLSERHFKLLYLKNQENKIYDAILVEKRGKLSFVLIKEIALIIKAHGTKTIELDSEVKIEITGIDIAKLEAFSKIINF